MNGTGLGTTSEEAVLLLVITAFFAIWIWTRWNDILIRLLGAALMFLDGMMGFAILDHWTPLASFIVIFWIMAAYMVLRTAWDGVHGRTGWNKPNDEQQHRI